MYGQGAFLSGYIKDAKTGEALIGANIFIKSEGIGTSTNNFGYYTLSISKGPGTYIVQYSYLGYLTLLDTIIVRSNTELIVELEPSNLLDTALVVGKKSPIAEITGESSIEINSKQIEEIPAILGEVDVIKALQLLPGVNGGTEASSGMYVRGGGNDQNLILLDGVPLYNVSHLFGFFSLFNTDAINNVKLYKGGFPSRFGGRLSSVIDITTIYGNTNKIGGTLSLGVLAGRLSLNGPIGKSGKTTFSVAARRSLFDLYLFQNDPESDLRTGYYFYDINGKVTHKIDNKSSISMSLYNGRDQFYVNDRGQDTFGNNISNYKENFRFGWGNSLGSIRYSRANSKKMFSSYTASATRFSFGISSEFEENFPANNNFEKSKFAYSSGITDYAAKADYEYRHNYKHLIRFGGAYIAHVFNPGRLELFYESSSGQFLDTILGVNGQISHESAVYIEDEFRFRNDLNGNIGFRLVNYTVNSKSYNYIEPRFSIAKSFDDKFVLFAAYSNMNQFVHLVANSGAALPTDLWLPASDVIAPMNSHQVSLGYRKNLGKSFDLVIEGYYKWMNNVIDYKEGQDITAIFADWEERVATGQGRSYGVEILLQKKVGKWRGWLGQTYSKTDRTIPEINFGRTYNFKYDRRVDISLTITYEYNKRNSFSANFVYGTGNALTLPIGQYTDNFGKTVFEYGNKNDYRMRDYHRMDIGYHRQSKKKLQGAEQSFNFSIYNVYARNNPFIVEADFEANPPVIREISLFNFIPGITYNLKF